MPRTVADAGIDPEAFQAAIPQLVRDAFQRREPAHQPPYADAARARRAARSAARRADRRPRTTQRRNDLPCPIEGISMCIRRAPARPLAAWIAVAAVLSSSASA